MPLTSGTRLGHYGVTALIGEGREAQVLASRNHPNIAAIYGVEEAEGTRALVLELVEGPTLADRSAQGPMLVDEALPIAKPNEPTDPHGLPVHSAPGAANTPLAEEGS